MTVAAVDRGLPPVDVDAVRRAAGVLDGVVHRTPVLTSATLDAQLGAQVFLKAEHLQRGGAFKLRGAYHAVSRLDPEVRTRGVVTFSSGNHAQALALAGRLHGVPVTVVMPEDAPTVKLAATRGYGAEIVLYDRWSEDRRALATAIAAERGATVVPPYDHPDIVAGQGTATLELLDQVGGDLDVLLAPIGGGGLLAGTAAAAGSQTPPPLVVGVEPAGRRAARDALATGEVVTVPVPQTILDGQQTPDIGAVALAVLTATGARVVGVADDAVRDTVRFLATRMKQVVEPSGASALAALQSGAVDDLVDLRGARVGVILSGGNVAPDVLATLLTESPAP